MKQHNMYNIPIQKNKMNNLIIKIYTDQYIN